MLLLGIDVGTSSVKVSVVDSTTQKSIASGRYPESEAGIISIQPGWAEQSPEEWWRYVQQAIINVHATGLYDPRNIAAIGISYQMHGLVLIDKNQKVLRNSIIWCDSRAVRYGEAAFEHLGPEKCLATLLNSPGNFTAAKLAWVKEHEPEIYEKVDKVLLPGDFIAMNFTGSVGTTVSALSEGVFWDFKENGLSKPLLSYFGFDASLLPEVLPVFATHGTVRKEIALLLSLKEGIPVSYKAGDQPNNALSLNVLEPGEVAATAGTSGVIYGVSDQLTSDRESRVNSFAHVNYMPGQPRIGVLLCINGTGILNSWLKGIIGSALTYQQWNEAAKTIEAGSEGLMVLPFGNGVERMLKNRMVGAHLENIDLNLHTAAHLYRAGQEGIAFAFRYGLEIMKENGMSPAVIRAGRTNMFLSPVFTEAFVNTTGVPVELYNNDGSMGAALGAGIGARIFTGAKEALSNLKPLQLMEPQHTDIYEVFYQRWKEVLQRHLNDQEQMHTGENAWLPKMNNQFVT